MARFVSFCIANKKITGSAGAFSGVRPAWAWTHGVKVPCKCSM